MRVAEELKIYIEPVPLEHFIPLPKDSENRQIRIGQFGNLEVFIADPYSIALSNWTAASTLISTTSFFSFATTS